MTVSAYYKSHVIDKMGKEDENEAVALDSFSLHNTHMYVYTSLFCLLSIFSLRYVSTEKGKHFSCDRTKDIEGEEHIYTYIRWSSVFEKSCIFVEFVRQRATV